MKTNLLNPKFMNKLSRKITLAAVGVPILGLCSLTAQAAGLTYSFLNTFDSATIDGDYSEWVPLASNVHVPMYEAGNPTKTLLSDLYLRYDCQSQTMFGLVLKQPGYEIEGAPWIKITQLGQSPVVDDNDNNLGNPTNIAPEFSWIPPSASVQANTEGYEASFPLAVPPGSYTMEVHVNIKPGRTSSTGRGDYFVNLDLTCPTESLTISKTANPLYTEEYEWDITKEVDPDSHTMFIGDPAQTSTYTVTVDQTLTEGQEVNGEITIINGSASQNAIIASIIDTITPGDISVAIDCGEGVTFPYTLPAGQTLTCSYTEILTSAFDGENEVIVVPANGSGLFGGQATADFVFDANTPIEVTGYPTVDVVDTREGGLQTDLDGDKTFTYTTDFGCPTDPDQYVNGKYEETYDNTAKIQKTEGGNTTVIASDDASVVKTCYAPTVSKTATTSFDRQHLWSIDKQVDPSELNMFINDSGEVTYTVTVDDSSFVDVNFAVEGNITVVNPNPDAPMTVNVADELPDATNLVLDCGGSLTVPAGNSANCGYSAQLPNNDTRTNTAKVTLNDIEFPATQEVAFSGTPTNVLSPSPATINVSDTNGQGWTTSDGASWDYTQSFSCSGDKSLYENGTYDYSHNNTATITETGQSDNAQVTVNCYAPVVSKTANTSFDREYEWDIEKTVDPSSLTMNIGDSGEVTYTVSVSTTSTDTNFAVTGNITVNNPHPTQPMTVTVADTLPDAIGSVTLDCGGSLTVPANGSNSCSYSASLPTNDTRTNTATATLNGIDFTDTAQVVFGDTPTNETGPSPSPINVTDTNGESWSTGEATSWTYTETFTCSTDTSLYVNGFYAPPDHDNTATITETGDSDTASVSLECYAPTVTKTANTSFDREYDWTIDKTATNVQERLILQLSQAFNVTYDITVDASSTDSNHTVSGDIVVSNPNPEDSMSVSVTDTLSDNTAATVTCPADPLVIAAGGSETCTYSADLTDGTSLTNTATATLNGQSFNSAPVDVIFSDPPATETDKCIDVIDTYPAPDGTDFGQVCADVAPQTFSYTRTLQYDDPSLGQDCTDPTVVSVEVPNTASFVVSSEPSSGETGSDNELVQVCIPTNPPGCSLTQGYWKTHSKYGPAPYDDTWKVDDGYGNLIDLEDVTFFLSGQSYYDVLWTPPQGNAYYILAVQWIAAYLNTLSGASMPSGVVDVWNEAQGLFEQYTPAEVANTRGPTGNQLRQQFIELAVILDAYNNGIIGPGHCSDDSPKAIIACNGFNPPFDQFFTVGDDVLVLEATLTNADLLPVTDSSGVATPWGLLFDTSNNPVRGFIGKFTYNSTTSQWERVVGTGSLDDGQYRAVMMSGNSNQYVLNPTCKVDFEKVTAVP